MTIALMEGVERWLNGTPLPSTGGLVSPAMIVEGRPLSMIGTKKISFGSYAMVYDGTDNTINSSRTVRAIALRESNDAGGYYFMSIETGRRIHTNKWVELPTTQREIDDVHSLVNKKIYAESNDDILDIRYDAPAIENPADLYVTPNIDREDGDEDEDDMNEHHNNQDLKNEVASDEEELDDVGETNTLSDSESESDSVHLEADVLNTSESETTDSEASLSSSTFDISSGTTIAPDDSTYVPSVDEGTYTINADEVDSMEHSFNINNAEEIEIHQGDTISDSTVELNGDNDLSFNLDDAYTTALNVMFVQMSAHKGIKLFGEKAIAAMFKELKQLNDGVQDGKPVIIPIKFDELTEKDKKEALEAVNLIAEKRCGTIKGRTCANGSKQRRYVSKMESFSSPTAALESIITTLMIDAYEGKDIAIADISGAYLHAEFPSGKRVILKLTGIFVDIMCEVNPEYKQHVIYEVKNGKKIKVLYVRVLRALYGCLESALLWYKLYSSTLKKLGFKINPYDKCVANKMINGKQCTIVFYVDDNKISHEDPEVVTEVLKQITEYFGELKVSRGVKHDYLDHFY